MELEVAFTPGPFVVNRRHTARNNDSEIVIELEGGSSPIAIVCPINTYAAAGARQQAANARLFAASNRLLFSAGGVTEIPWNPSDFVGYSDEQIALIRKGFEHALGLAMQMLRPAIEAAVGAPR